MPWGEVHWMDVARAGVRLAREALAETDRPASVAFSLNGEVAGPEGAETIDLLERAFGEEPPDLVLLETLSVVGPEISAVVERLVATGLPVWASFRRCRDGLCGVYGQHWGGPERDRFGRVAHRLEEMGVAALLVNCIPPDHVAGMVSWLRDFTDLPLGVYPDLGYLTEDGWQFATDVGGDEYAALAGQWREEGAQIVGGCCGVGPEHIAADAVSNAKTNAFRNGVPDRVATEVVDLYPWVPHERWEVIVASPFQMPVDRILGGCCGAGPEHIRALASRLPTTETHATARLDH